jgi:hypothetical protein
VACIREVLGEQKSEAGTAAGDDDVEALHEPVPFLA